MKGWSNIGTTYAVIGLSALLLLGQRINNRYSAAPSVEAQTPVQTSPSPLAPASQSNLPKLLKISLSLSSPKDLKVRQGDLVAAGEVLADRVEERSRLTAQRQELMLALEQIQARTITAPSAPVPIPAVKSLPPTSYAEEEAAIRAAATNVKQAERAVQFQQENFKSEPLEEAAGLQKAAVELQNRRRIVDIQLRKIDAVALLKDLPPSVNMHEQAVLKQRSAELQQAQAEYQQAQAKLTMASKAATEKLQQLTASVAKARDDYQLAIAKLQTKKDQRAYSEYEASVTAARRAEERNQAAENYSRQMQETEQQQRDRSFQVAQIQAKIADVDDKLRTISVVTSPYAGFVRRVKVLHQNDNTITAELTLVVGGAVPPPAPQLSRPFVPSFPDP